MKHAGLKNKLTIAAAFGIVVISANPTIATPCYYVDPAKSLRYGSESSNQITKETLPLIDGTFLAQTKGGMNRAVGSVELLALVRLVAVKHKQIPTTDDAKKQLVRNEMHQEIDRLGLSHPATFALTEQYDKFGEIPLDKLTQILNNIKNDFVGVRGYNGCQ